jgi:isoleucyl-tRNA synthetase
LLFKSLVHSALALLSVLAVKVEFSENLITFRVKWIEKSVRRVIKFYTRELLYLQQRVLRYSHGNVLY